MAPDTELGFKDPAKKRNLTFAVLPIGKLNVISHQRKASDAHVKRVVGSVERVGFVAPVVVVERDEGDGYWIIDGQHRFLAATELGLRQLPAVIVPRDMARRMLTLNVEKEPNIRERSAVALSIYQEMAEKHPKMAEDDAEVEDAVQFAHYVTLGFAYAESGRLAGSQFEPILKKCDSFMAGPLAECLPERQARAARPCGAHCVAQPGIAAENQARTGVAYHGRQFAGRLAGVERNDQDAFGHGREIEAHPGDAVGRQ